MVAMSSLICVMKTGCRRYIFRLPLFVFNAVVLAFIMHPKDASAGYEIDFKGQVGYVVWSSANSTFQGVQASLEDHYLRLANLGLLNTRTVTLEKSINFPSNFLNTHLPYFNWTSKIDNLLCDLNGHVCTRERRPSSLKTLQSTNHVMGHALTESSESTWRLRAGESVHIPNLSVSTQSAWHTQDVAIGNSSLRDRYSEIALGCPAAFSSASEAELTLLNRTFASLRTELRQLEPPACPSQIFRHNAYWLTYAAEINGAFREQSDQATIPGLAGEVVLSRIREMEALSEEEDHNGTWALLDQTLREIFRDDTIAARIELPIATLTSDTIIRQNIQHLDTLRSSSRWQDNVRKLHLSERLDLLPPKIYQKRIEDSEVLQKDFWVTEPELFQIQNLPVNEMVNRLNAESVDNLGIQTLSPSAGGWTFNSGPTRPVSGDFENSRHHAMIGLDPASVKQGFYASPIIFVEKYYDRLHCVFVGNCDIDRFEVVDGAKLTNLDQEDLLPNEKQRLMAIYNDMFRSNAEKQFHGIGVAAIALANPDSKLMHGVYPFAAPNSFFASIDMAAGFIEPSAWTRAKQKYLPAFQIQAPATWNISATNGNVGNTSGIVEIISDHLGDAIRNPGRDIFVVSGGHIANGTLDPNLRDIRCDFFPACHVTNDILRKSIITVVGVTRQENGDVSIWSQGDSPTDLVSFTHKDFQIAAPASGIIVPTIDPHLLGEVDGVSFAVPMVSATVTAMRSMMTLPASEVIARVMACARHYDGIRDRVVSGVLDVGCSLTLDRDLVAFNEDVEGNAEPVYQTLRKGRVLGIWQSDLSAAQLTRVIPFDDGDEVSGPWRARPVGAAGERVIFGIRQFGDSENELKVTGLKVADDEVVTELRGLLPNTLVMEFQPMNDDGTDDGTPVCFELTQLREYIPAASLVSRNWKAPPAPRCAR